MNHILGDGLDWHKERITLLFNPGHYDLLYTELYVGEFGRLLLEYDRIFPVLISDSENTQQQGECALCGKRIARKSDISAHACRLMHKYCLNEHILKVSNDCVLLTKEESKAGDARDCPVCHKKFGNKEIRTLFDREAYEIFRERRKARKVRHDEPMEVRSPSPVAVPKPQSQSHPLPRQDDPALELSCKLCDREVEDKDSFLHSCQGGYIHLECIVKRLNDFCGRNFGKAKNRISLLNELDFERTRADLVCPLCEELIASSDLKRMVRFDAERMPRAGDSRGSGSVPPAHLERKFRLPASREPLPPAFTQHTAAVRPKQQGATGPSFRGSAHAVPRCDHERFKPTSTKPRETPRKTQERELKLGNENGSWKCRGVEQMNSCRGRTRMVLASPRIRGKDLWLMVASVVLFLLTWRFVVKS